MINNAQIHKIAISNYSPVTIDIQDVRLIANYISWRFPSQLAQHDDFKEFLAHEWRDYVILNSKHTNDHVLFWETSKVVLYGRIISLISQQKKDKAKTFLTASGKLREA